MREKKGNDMRSAWRWVMISFVISVKEHKQQCTWWCDDKEHATHIRANKRHGEEKINCGACASFVFYLSTGKWLPFYQFFSLQFLVSFTLGALIEFDLTSIWNAMQFGCRCHATTPFKSSSSTRFSVVFPAVNRQHANIWLTYFSTTSFLSTSNQSPKMEKLNVTAA